MFKAMKECMRNWVMAHKKLYWYIVVGLAVFLFGLITAIGLAKLEKAEAAEDFYSIAVSKMEAMRDDSKKFYALFYVDVSEFDGDKPDYDFSLLFESDESDIVPFVLSSSSGYETLNFETLYYSEYEYDSNSNIVPSVRKSDFNVSSYIYDVEYVAGNMYLSSELVIPQGINIMDERPVPVVTSFFAGGPYLRLKDDYYYNTPYDNSVLDNESIAGVPMLGDCPVESWKWIYKGSIGGYLKNYAGTSTDVISNVKVQSTIDVGVPSRSWVAACIENMELSELRALRTEDKRNEWVKVRFKNGNMEDCIVSFSSNLFVTSDNKDFELTFNYTHMLEKVRETLGIDDWAEYYGVTDVQWDEFWSHIVFGYLTVNQMDSIVFNQYTDTDIMYGCYVSDVFTSGYNYSGYVYQDFFADSHACLDAMKTELQEAYESVIAASEKKLEEYETELESINKELEMLRADDTALFDIFADLADSLKNATGGFRSLSVAIGNVFGFFPTEMMACLMFAFLALLVISIVKALRG